MDWIIESFGLKRYITALLNVLSTIAYIVPSLNPFLILLQSAAGISGSAGLVHSAAAKIVEGNVAASKKATTLAVLSSLNLSSIVAVLLGIAQSVPAYHTAVPVLQALAGILGVKAVTTGLK